MSSYSPASDAQIVKALTSEIARLLTLTEKIETSLLRLVSQESLESEMIASLQGLDRVRQGLADSATLVEFFHAETRSQTEFDHLGLALKLGEIREMIYSRGLREIRSVTEGSVDLF